MTVAARSKAIIVFARSNSGVVCSNPNQGTDVCVSLFCVCVVLCVGSGQSYRQCIGLRNLKSGQGPKGCRATERGIERERAKLLATAAERNHSSLSEVFMR
jgi:hypothetical protein